MQAHKIAFRSLNRRGYLDVIDISRFNLCLHQKVPDSIDFFADNPQKADLILKNDRLFDRRSVGKAAMYPGNLKKTPLIVN